MKRAVFLLLAFCFVFSSCGVKPDFVISKETSASSQTNSAQNEKISVLINKNSRKYHLDPDCAHAMGISESNRLEIKVKNEEYLRERGYTPCAGCSSEQ